MLNVGLPEITVILVVALLLLGPQKLPEFARWVGKAMRELRQVTHEVRTAIDMELEKEELGRLQKEFTETLDPSFLQDAMTPEDPDEDGEEKETSDEEDKNLETPAKTPDVGIYHPGENADEYSFLTGASGSSEEEEDFTPGITPRPASDEPVETNLTKRFSSQEDTTEDQEKTNDLPIITGPPPGTVSRNAKDWNDDEEIEDCDDAQTAVAESQTLSEPKSDTPHSSEPTS